MPARKDPRRRIEALRREILGHDRRYYLEAAPTVSDAAYDALLRELRDLEEAHPQFATADSPTRRVGGGLLDGFATVEHRIPLLSLENAYAEAEIRAWDERVRKVVPRPRYAVEPKIDGVAVALIYRKGVFSLGATRGDGRRGDDITANLRTIRSLPLSLGEPRDLECRGEVYLTEADLERLNGAREAAGEEPLANPRNAAAGTLKLLDTEEVARRRLRLAVHSVADVSPPAPDSYGAALDLVERLGLPVVPHREACDGIDAVWAACRRWETRRHELPFVADGLVVKVDSFSDRREMGETSKAPRWAVAYKFPPEVAETRLERIDVQVGRTGVLTPVAHLLPVQLGGTTVSRATLHNEDQIARLDVRPGDQVRIQKAGEIIPQVVGVVPRRGKRVRRFAMPRRCPACDGPVVRPEGEAARRCENPSCPAQIRGRLLHYASRRAMNIETLGANHVAWLVERGIVRDIPDLYDLAGSPARLREAVSIERMGKKTVENILVSIERSRAAPLERFLFALGIPGVGERTAADLAAHFGSIDRIAEASGDDLLSVPQVGDVLAAALARFFGQAPALRLLERLRGAGLAAFRERAVAAGPLAVDGPLLGKAVVVTGAVPGMSRPEAEAAVRRLGGHPAASVSKRTALVVVGEGAGSKHDRALALEVPTMSAAEFARLAAGAAGPSEIEDAAPDEEAIRARARRAIEKALA